MSAKGLELAWLTLRCVFWCGCARGVRQDAMVMEVDVRWCGEANITLAIELSAG